jgi:hypothetical protein
MNMRSGSMGKLEKAAGVAAGTSALAGLGMNAAGLYVITNATTGAAMLGSTAAGATAAGTAGILAGTGGVVGTVGAVLLAPAFIACSAGVAAFVVGRAIYKKRKT